MLLLNEANRFSIDIDIICQLKREELEAILNKLVKNSKFTDFKLDQSRSFQPGIPKAHYKFSFNAINSRSGTIMLDVLIEAPLYPRLLALPIKTKWIASEGETTVTVPSIDSIAGDKLTAFAPNTIGIPYFKGSDQQSFAMEICKQLFDLSKLFEQIGDIAEVAASYRAFAAKEIAYRKAVDPEVDITPDAVLTDTIDTCLILATRGGRSISGKLKYTALQKGIMAFGTGYLMRGTFRIDEAIAASARIAYLAAKLLVGDSAPIVYFNNQAVNALHIEAVNWNYLNRLKRLPDKSAFFYWFQTALLLSTRSTARENFS